MWIELMPDIERREEDAEVRFVNLDRFESIFGSKGRLFAHHDNPGDRASMVDLCADTQENRDTLRVLLPSVDGPSPAPVQNPDDDLKTSAAMIRYGGSFVAALGDAARQADSDNLRRLKEAFPDYWKKYRAMGEVDFFTNLQKLSG